MQGDVSTLLIMAKKAVGSTLGLALALATLPIDVALAQGILPTPNTTGTQSILNGNQWDITGGALSADQLNLFHQFQQFGLTEGQIANFLANPNLRNIISTVDGGNPSIINGLLQVTGGNPNLFLMNPSGIVFGPNAQLNVPASFSAITADGIQFGDRWLNVTGPNDYSSLMGDPTAFRFSSDFAGAIVNAGNLQVNPGAALSLMGGTVINTGQLTAPQGQILITAVPGESLVRLALPGYILNLEVEVPLVEGNTPQTWQLPITALPTLITQGLTPELLGLAINSSGGVQLANGTPVPNLPGTAMVAGGVDVSGNQGGTVAVLGDRVGLVGAQINASGTQGGGQIRIGGDYQGAGTLPNAQRTYVDANTTIAADALDIGNGGRIIIWADEATGVYGDITARGGQLSGDGGFAEVSGRDYLQFDGTADLSSNNGESGLLLLDPATITISNVVGTTPGVDSALPNILLDNFTGQDITINQAVLEATATTNRITLQADQRITIGDLNESLEVFNDPTSGMTPTLTLGNGATFLVRNGAFEVLNQASRILTNGGDLNITAQSITTGRILTSNPGGNAGAVNLTATQRDITTDIRAQVANFDLSIAGRGGDISLSAPNGGITVNNNLVSISANGDSGNINLEARDNIVINCAVGANYCIESFGGGLRSTEPGSPSILARGNSGSISFISRQGSVEILNSPLVGANAINTANDRFSAGSITIQAAESIDIGGRLLADGATSNAPISLTANSINLVNGLEIANDSGGQSIPANININGSVNGSNSGGQSLTINSGRGNVIFNDSIGSTIPIGNLTVSGQQATISGDIRTANSPIIFNSPVNLNNSSPLTFNSGTATITLNGLNAGNTPLTLIASDFTFSGTLRGNNTLTIQPSPLSRGITLGNTVNNTLNLSPAEIVGLRGFSNVTIGGSSGDITVNAPVTFNTPTQLSTTGNINVSGNITTTGQNLTFGSNINLEQDVTLSTGTGAGNLSFLGTITGQPHHLTLEAGTGNILLPRQVNVRQFNVNSAQTLFLGEGITTANTPLTFNVPVVLTQNSAIRTGTPGASITFGNTLNSEAGESNNLTLAAGGGDISINGAVGNTQPLDTVTIESLRSLTTNAPIQAGSLQQTGTPATGNIVLNDSVTTNNGSVNLNASGAITANTITTNGGGIALSGNTIEANTLTSTGGGISAQAAGTVSAPTVSGTGGVALISTGSNVQTNTITTNGGDVTLDAQTNLAVDNVTTNGGDIALRSRADTITVNTLSSASGTAAGGNITISNPNAINAAAINTSGATTGGDITLTGDGAPTGTVTTGNLTATGVANGGNITVLARDSITTGEIDTSATVGNGGNVLLDPLGDVQVTFINAQGGTNGAGGNVVIESVDRFFRATGAFPDRNGILASISTAGGGGEGTIRITHNGGAANVLVPFIISTASDNGTVGALTTGANNIIFPGSFLGPYTQGNIDIITSPQATQLADASLPDTLPEEIQPADADNQPFWLDEYFTRRTEDYLGINGETRVKSLEEIQDELQRIEDITGVKPALIYVVFEPEVILRTIQEEGQINPEDMVNQGSLMRLEPSDHLQLILVTAEGQPILRRPNDERAVGSRIPAEVEQLRQKILQDFTSYQRTGVTRPNRYLPSARLLYQWLLEPLLADLEAQEIENLVFIMDTGLRSAPLAALPAMHDGTSFIVENYSVGLMPSFSLTDTRIEDIRNSQVLAMGMTDFSEHSGFNDLLAVRDEIGLITQRLWPSVEDNLDNLLDDEFTPSVLTSRRRRQPAGIVHLATHTKFNSEEPGDSFIIFADNQLSFDDFRSLEFANPPVELLVLSSCTTALSAEDDRAELGFAGISVQAGVKSSLASLWEVNDVGTLGLMVEFYSQLQTAPIKAIALQEAQLAMIRGDVFLEDGSLIWSSGDTALSFSTANIPNTASLSRHLFSHPGYWAGFTIIGNPW